MRASPGPRRSLITHRESVWSPCGPAPGYPGSGWCWAGIRAFVRFGVRGLTAMLEVRPERPSVRREEHRNDGDCADRAARGQRGGWNELRAAQDHGTVPG